MTEKIDPAHEIPEDVIEKAVSAVVSDAGMNFPPEHLVSSWRSVIVNAAPGIAAWARGQALAEAEEAANEGADKPQTVNGVTQDGWASPSEWALGNALEALAALRRKEGGE
ncbi:hypothetical protein [Mycetocola saprophilus]|uniref:hypothetical protein n=1 Tax=Mycetocola saprophilus TaxID=76636 RepID=UPI0004C0D72A|nr:hypothetical protein [Mycetocola saprophilus]